MPSVQALSYDPTLKTVTVAGDIATASLTSIVNQTRGKDLFVVGRTPITNRVFSGGNTTFTLDINTEGDSAGDVLAVRYQSNGLDGISVINGGGVRTIKALTQAEYDAIPIPDPETLYIITD